MKVATIRHLTQQDGWKTEDGRMRKKCCARQCIPGATRHFFVFPPSCCVRSLLSMSSRFDLSSLNHLSVSHRVVIVRTENIPSYLKILLTSLFCGKTVCFYFPAGVFTYQRCQSRELAHGLRRFQSHRNSRLCAKIIQKQLH